MPQVLEFQTLVDEKRTTPSSKQRNVCEMRSFNGGPPFCFYILQVIKKNTKTHSENEGKVLAAVNMVLCFGKK